MRVLPPPPTGKDLGPLLRFLGLLLRDVAPCPPLCPPGTQRGELPSGMAPPAGGIPRGRSPTRLSKPAPGAVSRRPRTQLWFLNACQGLEGLNQPWIRVLPSLTRESILGDAEISWPRLRPAPLQPRPAPAPPRASISPSRIRRIPIKHLGEISAAYK